METIIKQAPKVVPLGSASAPALPSIPKPDALKKGPMINPPGRGMLGRRPLNKVGDNAGGGPKDNRVRKPAVLPEA